ncbi:MAG: hypothetical protein D3M94_03550 [Rhodocyclales bacterium GT-UBC]|nr:MAG: hypothetical protein D3M94_03550 [Rhodocyclales bacterium GT-UBC]
MKKSYYFAELWAAYDAEISDLLTDSEGKSALKARLKEKRSELQAILPMIDFSPEMVVPVFYEAFSFPNKGAMNAAVLCEPDDDDFPTWDRLSQLIKLADWALPLQEAVLGEATGEAFMVTAACLEYLRCFDQGAPNGEIRASDDDADKDGEEGEDDGRGDDDEESDLGEAGDDWLAEQGFDSARS